MSCGGEGRESRDDPGGVAAPSAIAPMLRRVMEATLVLDPNKIRAIGFVPKYPRLETGRHHET